jgi:hypothetical protein
MTDDDASHTGARARGRLADSVNLEARDKVDEKPVHEVFVEGDREIHYIRRPGDCLQMVYERGELVHLDCKAPDCGNNWKLERGEPLENQFRIDWSLGRITVVCLDCERDYFVTQVSSSPGIGDHVTERENGAD